MGTTESAVLKTNDGSNPTRKKALKLDSPKASKHILRTKKEKTQPLKDPHLEK